MTWAPPATAEGPGEPEPVSRRARRRRGSIGGLAFAIALAGPLGLVTGPLVAHALGPQGRGEVAAATVFGTLAWMVLALGLPWAVGHRAAVEPASRPRLLGSVIRYAAFVVLPLALAGAALLTSGPLDDFSAAGAAGAFILFAAAPLNMLTQCQQAMLMAESALRPLSVLRALPVVLSAMATIVLAIAGALTVATYLATTIAAGLVINAVTWRCLGVRPRGRAPMRPLLWFGVRNVGAQLAAFGNRAGDQAILAVFVGTRQLGLYAVAVTVANVPLSLAQAVGTRAFGDVAKAPEEQRMEVAAYYLRLSLLIGILAAAAIAVTGPVMLPLLFGRSFRPAVVPLLLLLPGGAAIGLGMTAARTLTAIDRPGTATVAEFIGLAVTAIGLAIAIPTLGIRGAAIVSSFAYWVRVFVQLRILRASGLGSIRPSLSDARDLGRLGLVTIRRGLRGRGRQGGGGGRRDGPGKRGRPPGHANGSRPRPDVPTRPLNTRP